MAYKFNPFTGTLDEVGAGGGGGTPGGSDTQVQFNDGGSAFGGDTGLTFNKTTNTLTVGVNNADPGTAVVKGDINLDDGGSWTTTLQTITPTQDNTISLPNATGTVALVAGSSGQPIYNNAGVYAGLSTATIGTTGNITLSLNGASGVAPVALTGTWFAGTTPQVLIQPSNVGTAGAWSPNGTGIGVNAISTFTGNLLDLQVNGTRALAVKNDGGVTAKTDVVWNRTNGNSLFYVGTNAFGIYNTSQTNYWFSASGVELTSSFYYGWASGTAGSSSADLTLFRDAANTLAQRNGTNAQTFRVYNTHTSSSEYERGKLEWSGNVFRIGTEKGSGGGTARALELQTDGTTRATIAPTAAALTLLDVSGNSGVVLQTPSSNVLNVNLNGSTSEGASTYYRFNTSTGFQVHPNCLIGWGSSNAASAADTALTRSAANVVKVTNGSTGDGTLLAQHRLTGTAPATASSTGTAGDIRYDADYIYVCTATNTWKRAALAATW